MKVLIRIQKVYKNLTKRSLQICWDDEQTPGSPISSPTHQEDFEKRVSMTLIISYLALILNFTIAISTIYFLLNDLLPKWILPRQSVYRDSVNDLVNEFFEVSKTGNKTPIKNDLLWIFILIFNPQLHLTTYVRSR